MNAIEGKQALLEVEATQDHAKRIALCEAALAKKVSHRDVKGALYCHLARSFKKMGHLGRAHHAANSGIAACPNGVLYQQLHITKLEIFLDKKRFKEVKQLAQRVLTLPCVSKNTMVSYRYLLAKAHSGLGEYMHAEDLMHSTLKVPGLSPEMRAPLVEELVLALFYQKKHTQLFLESNDAPASIKDKDIVANIYRLRGESLFQREKYVFAEIEIMKGVNTRSQDPAVNTALFIAYAQLLIRMGHKKLVEEAIRCQLPLVKK